MIVELSKDRSFLQNGLNEVIFPCAERVARVGQAGAALKSTTRMI